MSLNFNRSLNELRDDSLDKKIALSGNEHQSIQLKIINQFFPPDYAATGQLLEELVNQIKEEFGDISVFTSQPSYAFDRDDAPRWEHEEFLTIRRSDSGRLWRTRIRGKTLAGFVFFLRAALHLVRSRRRRELVLLTTAPPFLPFLGYLISRVLRISYICLLYDLYPDIAVELGVVPKQHWITRFWNTCNVLTWKNAQSIIVLSDTMKDRIVRQYPNADSKIVVIPSWANIQEIRPIAKSQNWFAQQHDLVEPFTVLYSGNMGRCHDVDTLLNAIITLQDTAIKFVFIGSGDKRDYLKSRLDELSVNNFLFLPYQARENLPFSLTACDVSIVSIAEEMEGLIAPSKLYSALAAGSSIAAICPAHSYLNSVIGQAKCGGTFRNGDSQGLANYLRHLSQNPLLVKEMGKAGREFCVKNYSREKVAQEYLELFQALVTAKQAAKK